jgi:hypothetical protein
MEGYQSWKIKCEVLKTKWVFLCIAIYGLYEGEICRLY